MQKTKNCFRLALEIVYLDKILLKHLIILEHKRQNVTLRPFLRRDGTNHAFLTDRLRKLRVENGNSLKTLKYVSEAAQKSAHPVMALSVTSAASFHAAAMLTVMLNVFFDAEVMVAAPRPMAAT